MRETIDYNITIITLTIIPLTGIRPEIESIHSRLLHDATITMAHAMSDLITGETWLRSMSASHMSIPHLLVILQMLVYISIRLLIAPRGACCLSCSLCYSWAWSTPPFWRLYRCCCCFTYNSRWCL
jgi:hypothetical protein